MCQSQFRSFALPQLLPAGHVLVINTRALFFDHYIITQMSDQVYGLVAQQLFSDQELYALVALLEAYPDYCSYETLLSVLSDKTVEQARQVVHAALEGKN